MTWEIHGQKMTHGLKKDPMKNDPNFHIVSHRLQFNLTQQENVFDTPVTSVKTIVTLYTELNSMLINSS